ncbi:MAG: glutamyl-tRNA amidotransferase, partial [Chloroflexia bacterium]|nr:glutamyl-tRNA amidotransferase [Chloroflexia bacterium]
MMNMHQRLQNDMKEAMRARDQLRVETLRMAMNAIKTSFDNLKKQAYDAAGGESNMAASQAAVDAVSLSEAQMIEIIIKEVKRRRESVEIYRKGNRLELAEKEEKEVAILEAYLPRMLSADELRPQIAAIIAQVGAKGAADMNKV